MMIKCTNFHNKNKTVPIYVMVDHIVAWSPFYQYERWGTEIRTLGAGERLSVNETPDEIAGLILKSKGESK